MIKEGFGTLMIQHKFKTWFPERKIMSLPWNLSERIRDIVINPKEEQEENDYTQVHINRAYTGCKDKNNKEIYCGDIVSCNGVFFYIDFLFGAYLLCPPEGSAREKEFLAQFEPFRRSGIEVIGNIYENPELVDGSKGL